MSIYFVIFFVEYMKKSYFELELALLRISCEKLDKKVIGDTLEIRKLYMLDALER